MKITLNPVDKRKLEFLPFLILSVLLFSYTCYRAYAFSLTCDEGSTFLNHMDRGFFDCMFNPDCWAAANNHLLNTKGMAFFSGIFGPWEWALRLPNLLLHLCYIGASLVIVYRLSERFVLRLFGFVLFNFQPLILEFFALARGYALGTGFMLLSICFMVLSVKKQNRGWIVAGLFSGLLAVYSNFIFIVFLAAYGGALIGMAVLRRKSLPDKLRWGWVYAILALVVMAATVYVPVTTLSTNAEFQYGVGTLFTAFTSLMQENLFRREWIGVHTVPVFTGFFLMLSVASAILGIVSEFRNPGKNLVHTMTSVIFILMVAFMVANHWILGAQYPEGRKMILFVPILSVLIYQLFIHFPEKRSLAINVTAMLFVVLFLDHIRYALNFESTRTWYYDVCTKKFMLDLKEETSGMQEEPTIGIHWIFSPASKYYIQTREIPFRDVGRMDQITGKILFDYYYVDQNDTSKLMNHYHILEDCGPYMILERNCLEGTKN